MGPDTERRVMGAFLIVLVDLWFLLSLIVGTAILDYTIIVCIVSVIASVVCTHCLNRRIEEQESEELKEDLKDDIDRISLIALVVGCILLIVLVLQFD